MKGRRRILTWTFLFMLLFVQTAFVGTQEKIFLQVIPKGLEQQTGEREQTLTQKKPRLLPGSSSPSGSRPGEKEKEMRTVVTESGNTDVPEEKQPALCKVGYGRLPRNRTLQKDLQNRKGVQTYEKYPQR